MEFLPWKTPAMDEWMKTPFGAKMIQVSSCYNESLNEHFKMCVCLPSTKLTDLEPGYVISTDLSCRIGVFFPDIMIFNFNV